MDKFIPFLIAVSMSLISYTSHSNEFFKIQQGDDVSFVNEQNEQQELKVIATSGENWKKFNSFLGQENLWVWSEESSEKLYVYNQYSETKLLVDFSQSAGTEFTPNLNECVKYATIVSKNATIQTPAGEFKNTTELVFSGNCRDAGVSSAWFAKGVGLVQWHEQSIIGPRRISLNRASISGVEYPIYEGVELSAQFTPSPILLSFKDSVTAHLIIRNATSEPKSFVFNSSQLFDIILSDSNGQVVNQWSADKRFLFAIQEIVLAPGEVRRFGGSLLLKTFEGNKLDVGTYKVRVELKGSDRPQATAFEPMEYAVEMPIYVDDIVTIQQKATH